MVGVERVEDLVGDADRHDAFTGDAVEGGGALKEPGPHGHRLQGEAIAYHTAHGHPMHSSLRAALVGFLTGTTLFFMLIMLTALYMTLTGQVPEMQGQP